MPFVSQRTTVGSRRTCTRLRGGIGTGILDTDSARCPRRNQVLLEVLEKAPLPHRLHPNNLRPRLPTHQRPTTSRSRVPGLSLGVPHNVRDPQSPTMLTSLSNRRLVSFFWHEGTLPFPASLLFEPFTSTGQELSTSILPAIRNRRRPHADAGDASSLARLPGLPSRPGSGNWHEAPQSLYNVCNRAACRCQ